MSERNHGHMFDKDDARESRTRDDSTDDAPKNNVAQPTLAESLRNRLRGIRNTADRRRVKELARGLSEVPADRARAALEIGASLAATSLRVCVEFLRVAPDAARVLETDELRAWGDIGRRLTLADVETGAQFFARGASDLSVVPHVARQSLFELCARQMTLSSLIATETLRRAPELAIHVKDAATLARIYQIALEVARRSAKHSADFLHATPATVRRLQELAMRNEPHDFYALNDVAVTRQALDFTDELAARAGGVAAEVWASLDAALKDLQMDAADELFRFAEEWIERGGTVAASALAAGGEVLRLAPEAFDEWRELLREISASGNAVLINILRRTPQVLRQLGGLSSRAKDAEASSKDRVDSDVVRVVRVVRAVAAHDEEAALGCFRSAPVALTRAGSIEQFERWAQNGLDAEVFANARARRSYFALETRRSAQALLAASETERGALQLDDVMQTLRLYVEALTGRAVEIASLDVVPQESGIEDGRTIHLPAHVSEFQDEESNFKLYKVLAAHAAGQIEFGTRQTDTAELRAAYEWLAETFAEDNADAQAAFALNGYIESRAESEPALAPEEEARLAKRRRKRLPAGGDFRAALRIFPQTDLAGRIFGTLENARIDRRLRHTYKGLRRDLDLVREALCARRPPIAQLPAALVPFELLFQIALCGAARDDARRFYSQIVSELESVVADYLTNAEATVADTLLATARVYQLFQSVVPEASDQQSDMPDRDAATSDAPAEAGRDAEDAAQAVAPELLERDARELFSQWSRTNETESDLQDSRPSEHWQQQDAPEQPLEAGDTAFSYDEWDRELLDMRVGWCRVIEKKVRRGDRSFVELARSRHKGAISSLRHQFQLMKPEGLRRVINELDGDDYDLNAVIDHVTDRRTARRIGRGQPSERLYTKRLRRERDVAVAFLLDQSSSTARTIGRHPLQPYTRPGRRIIEIEKEGLVLMSEALEAVGDRYAIYGFSSEGRRNVKFYVVKDFDERYTEETERKIGGINYQQNTRLGAAVRHAAARLAREQARTRLLILISDGRPYDHDYGDAAYAREDTREALRQARLDDITPFCITIDRDSEAELRDLYGEVGYTIIDDALSLPERIPAIYRRLTT